MDNSFSSAYKKLISRNSQYKQQVVDNILQQSGIPHTHIVDAIHDTPDKSTASVAASLHDEDLNKVMYGAAWYGLYTDTPHTTVFTTDPKGLDAVYKFHMAGNGEEIRNKLTSYGLNQRLLIPSNEGFHVMIHDSGRKDRDKVVKLLNDHNIDDAEESLGSSVFLGSHDKKQAREEYRKQIQDFENNKVTQ